MSWVSSTMAVAGQSTVSTGPSCARVTKGAPGARRHACTRTITAQASRATDSQNGKKPLRGPSVPHPIPRRRASSTTMPPTSASIDAVTRSATRMLLLEQAALGHQVLVKLLVLLHPLHVLGPGREGGFQRALLEVLLPLRRLGDLLEERHIPSGRFLGHVGRPEDAPQHEVVEIGAQRLLHGGH